MYRDLPSGIRKLPRSLSSVLVQGSEYRISKHHKIQVGVASCTNARNTYVGEAWSVFNQNSSAVQVGLLDSRENRAFDTLNSNELNKLRDWNQLGLSKYSRQNTRQNFLFSSYVKGRGSFSAVTPSSIVASKLASQFLESSSSSSTKQQQQRQHQHHLSTSIPSSDVLTKGTMFQVMDGVQDADVSFSAFAADLALREELIRATKYEIKNQNSNQMNPSLSSSSSSSSPMQTGCRGVWANVKSLLNQSDSSKPPLLKLEVHNVGDARALLILNKDKHIGTSTKKPKPSSTLQRLLAKNQALPDSYKDLENTTREVDNFGLPLSRQHQRKNDSDGDSVGGEVERSPNSKSFDEATRAFNEVPSAMHPKLLHRRLRIDPVSIDHRPLRPEEARRIGRAGMIEDSKITSTNIKLQNEQQRNVVDNNNKQTASASSSRISRNIITDDEFLRGDFAVDVSRAFGHFHLKNCQQLSPDEQMLSCRPETVIRFLEVGDVLVLGNKPLFSPSTPNCERFVGGWGVTLDSVAAHVIGEFDDDHDDNGKNVGKHHHHHAHEVARDLIQLSLLSGAEHNLSVAVMRVLSACDDQHHDSTTSGTAQSSESETEIGESSITNFVEYPIVGEVFPYLLQNLHQQPQHEVYSHALRRDCWRLGFKTVGEFAQARGETLAVSYQKLQETLKNFGGSKEKPSISTPLDLWQNGLASDVCDARLLMTHPSAVSNLIREMQAEMDWCEKESKRQ